MSFANIEVERVQRACKKAFKYVSDRRAQERADILSKKKPRTTLFGAKIEPSLDRYDELRVSLTSGRVQEAAERLSALCLVKAGGFIAMSADDAQTLERFMAVDP